MLLPGQHWDDNVHHVEYIATGNALRGGHFELLDQLRQTEAKLAVVQKRLREGQSKGTHALADCDQGGAEGRGGWRGGGEDSLMAHLPT